MFPVNSFETIIVPLFIVLVLTNNIFVKRVNSKEGCKPKFLTQEFVLTLQA